MLHNPVGGWLESRQNLKVSKLYCNCFIVSLQFHDLVFVVFVQQMLLNAAKDVASALGALINATKNASGKSTNDPVMEPLKTTGKVLYRY